MNEINDLTTELVKDVGRALGKLDFAPRMVCIEGLAAGLIAFTAIQYNKSPEEMVEAFCERLRQRVDLAIYGRKH